MSEPATASQSVSPFHQPAVSNDGTPLPPLASHTQRHDAPSGPDAHRIARMTAGELAQLEIGDEIRATQSTVHRRHPDGAVTIEPRKAGAAEQSPVDPSQAAGPDKIRVGDVELTAQQVQDLLIDKANADARRATMPAGPEGYELTLPADLKLPPGIDFKLDSADPLLASARTWAHSKGLDQQSFSELLGLYATATAGSESQIQTARAAEIQKLGVNGPVRVTALQTFFTGLVGSEKAKAISSMMATAGIVEALEAVHGKFVNQGAASFSQSHREPGGPSRMTEEQWAGMSDAARLDYARSHSHGARA